MEGFLHLKLPQWIIRIGTRIFALLPVIIVAVLFGHQEKTLDQLLVYSQVFLSIALPFSIFPLIYLTFKKSLMGEFTNADRNLVLDFASHLKIEKGSEAQDNGITQTVTVRDGVASLAQAKTPNPVTLRPYRTFNEVEQPASQFVFRVNKSANLALFEADGGKWKLDAVKNISDYLKTELANNDKITILA